MKIVVGRAECSSCLDPAAYLCDWKLPGRLCSARLCAGHTTEAGLDKHLCPPHASRWRVDPRNPKALAMPPERGPADEPIVWNLHGPLAHVLPVGTVYIGRPSKWGNPMKIDTNASERSREAAVAFYRTHLRAHPELVKAARAELHGKHLACFCAPKLCHGDVLLRVAAGGEP